LSVLSGFGQGGQSQASMNATRMLVAVVLWCSPLCGFSVKSRLDDDLVLNVPYSSVFVATKHIKNILRHIKLFESEAHPRPLQCLDLFAGGGTIYQAWTDQGLMSRAVDVKFGPSHDMLTEEGFTMGQCGYVSNGVYHNRDLNATAGCCWWDTDPSVCAVHKSTMGLFIVVDPIRTPYSHFPLRGFSPSCSTHSV
jgi:hypothetical protein